MSLQVTNRAIQSVAAFFESSMVAPNFPKVESALTITADAVHDSNEIVFIVPRNDDILLIGGIAEPNMYDLSL